MVTLLAHVSQLVHHKKIVIPELNLDQAEQTSPFSSMALPPGRDKGCVITHPGVLSNPGVVCQIQGPEKPEPLELPFSLLLSPHGGVCGDRINVVLKVI